MTRAAPLVALVVIVCAACCSPALGSNELSVVLRNSTEISLSWSDDLPNYQLKFRRDPSTDGKFGGPDTFEIAHAGTFAEFTTDDTVLYTVSGLIPDTAYNFSLFTLDTSSNVLTPTDSVVASTTEAAPTASPTSITLQLVDGTTMSISWQPPSPSMANGAITAYTVVVTVDGESMPSATQTVDGSQTSATVDSLSPFTLYTVTVAASTAAGMGPASFPAYAQTPESEPTSPPQRIAVNPRSATSVIVTWAPPLYPNGIIYGYTIRFKPASAPDSEIQTIRVEGSTTSYVMSGLTGATLYSASVNAFTLKGAGPFSAFATGTTAEDTPSQSPQDLEAAAISSSAIVVTWMPQSEGLNGVLVGYQVRYVRVEDALGNTVEDDVKVVDVDFAMQVEVTVGNLQSYNLYRFEVAAKTMAGVGVFSPAVTERVGQGVPGTPLDVRGSTVSDTAIELSWEPASPPNGIPYYTLRYYPVGGAISSAVNVSELTAASYQAKGLTSGQLYVFQVQAFTKAAREIDQVGQSDFSEQLEWSTDFDSPLDAPSNLTSFTRSSTSIGLQWGLPRELDGTLEGYTIRFFIVTDSLANARVVTVGSNVTAYNLTGLEEFSVYEIRVYAIVDGKEGSATITRSETLQDTPSAAPQSLEYSRVSSTAATLSWQAPPSIDRNGILTGYRVYVQEGADPAAVPASINEFTSTFEVAADSLNNMLSLDNLIPYTPYYFTVAASTAVGEGVFATPVLFETSSAPPAIAPQNFTVTDVTRTSIAVEWAPISADNTNGIFATYTVYWQRSTSTNALFYDLPGTEFARTVYANTSFVIEGLLPSLNYNISVSASSDAGEGPRSADIVQATFESEPAAAPRRLSVSVDAEDLMASLQWDPVEPRLRNGDVKGYVVRAERFGERDTCESIVCEAANDCNVVAGCEDGVCLFSERVDGTTCGVGESAGVCFQGDCVPYNPPEHANDVQLSAHYPISYQYSDGAGYMPYLKEIWYPRWSTYTIYRTNRHHQYFGTLVAGGYTSNIKQLWGEPDSLYYYTANYGDLFCAKLGPYPDNTRVWTYNMPSPPTGVATDDKYMYCIHDSASDVHVVHKANGTLSHRITLSGTGYSTGTVNGLFVVARGKMYIAASNSVYRFSATTGAFESFSFSVATSRNMFFDGQNMCVGDGSSNVYCYELFDKNIYEDTIGPLVHLDEPIAQARLSISTYSYGAGFNPVTEEFWSAYSSSASSTIYAFREKRLTSRSFNTVTTNINQIWVDKDGTYYLASSNYVYKVENRPSASTIWQANLENPVGSVSADDDFVYAMNVQGSVVYRLSKETGHAVSSFELVNSQDTFTNTRNGLFVVHKKIYHIDSTSSRRVFRYNLNGTYEGVSFAVAYTMIAGSFTGRDICVSDGGSYTYCYQVLSRNIYDVASQTPHAPIQGSDILTAEEVDLFREQGVFDTNAIYKRCYSGTTDGFSATYFHNNCNNLGPTVSVMLLNNDADGQRRIFGGYISTSWRGNYYDEPADEAWLYRIVNGALEQTSGPSNYQYAFYDYSSYCPTYGRTNDLRISSDCRSGSTSANYYSAPGYSSTWLAGATSFYLDDIEVFYRAEIFDACTDLVCVSDSPCLTNGRCEDGECVYDFVEDGRVCDDGDNSTLFDYCDAGVCLGYELVTSETSYTVDNLQLYQRYGFSVSAFTAVGLGPFSRTIEKRVGTAVPSGAPRRLTASALTNSDDEIGLSISWRSVEGSERNGEILGYKLQYRRGRDSDVSYGNVSDTFRLAAAGNFYSYEIKALEANVNYDVRVLAYTAVGDGPWSAIVSAGTTEDEPSAPPQQVAASYKNQNLRVTWSPPPSSQINGELTSYTMELVALSDASSWLYGERTFNSTTIALDTSGEFLLPLSAIIPFLSYRLRIAARNGVGQGPFTEWVTVDAFTPVPSGVPRSVSVTLPAYDITVYPPPSTELVVSWVVPSSVWYPGTPVNAFTIIVLDEASSSANTYVLPVSYSPQDSEDQPFTYVATGLDPDTTYRVLVSTVGLGGRGIASDPVSNTTRNGLPAGSPANVVASSITTNTADIAWDMVPEDEQNGDIVGYNLFYVPVADPHCEDITCSQPNQCQEPGVCEFGVCKFQLKPNGTACDDGFDHTINDHCMLGECIGEAVGEHVSMVPPSRHLYIYTRSYGAAYNPRINEYWFPQWSSNTVYRYDSGGVYTSSFANPTTNLMQIWVDPYSDDLYTANWGQNYCAKQAFYASAYTWIFRMDSTTGGVSSDQKYVYCMSTSSSTVFVIDKEDGTEVRRFDLQGGAIGTLYGGLAVVRDKLFYITGSTIYRHNLDDGRFDGFSITTTFSTVTNMFFNGQDICVSSGSYDIYCYRVLTDNIWSIATSPKEVQPTFQTQRSLTYFTRGYGGGYYPPAEEHWMPSWNSATVYRYKQDGTYLGAFTAAGGSRDIRQIWGTADSHYYLATTTFVIKARYPSNEIVWSYNVGDTVGGVSEDNKLVYVMRSTGNKVIVLSASTGTMQRTFSLNPLGSGDAFGDLYGGFGVVFGKLFRVDTEDRTMYRYSTDTGRFDNSTTSMSFQVQTFLFDGQDICVSDGSYNTDCYRILLSDIYDIPISGETELIEGTTLLNTEMNQKLSQELPARIFRRCYSGVEDGFGASIFREGCTNKGPTVTIARVASDQPGAGRIFGAYTDLPWIYTTSGGNYYRTNNPFLFKFEENDFFRTDATLQNNQYGMYDNYNYCPTFGGGHDLYLDSSCRRGYANPHSYRIAAGGYTNSWLAGGYTVVIDAIEVFYATDQYDPCATVTCERTECMLSNTCVFGECRPVYAPDALVCNDNDPTTAFDTCQSGVCIGTKLFTQDQMYTLEGLSAGRTYGVSVRAYTSVGAGPYSDAIVVEMEESEPTGPPTRVTVSPMSSTSILVTWEPPLPDLQNGVIKSYELYAQRTAKSDAIFHTSEEAHLVGSGRFTSYVVSGLHAFTEYAFKVRARNTHGFSPFSEDTLGITGEDLPGAPTNVQADEHPNSGGEVLDVTWAPPNAIERNGVILWYTVYWRSIGGEWQMRNATGNDSSIEIPDLTPFTSYKVKVTAWTVVGEGADSRIVTPTTGFGVPRTPPRNVSAAVLSSSEIKIEFLEPMSDEGNLTGYTIFYKPDLLQTSCDDMECVASSACTYAGECYVDDIYGPLCTNPIRPDGTVCDDGDVNTQFDVCIAGTCRGQTRPRFITPRRVVQETWPTRSYGMGYSPRHQRWWFPQYGSTSYGTIVYVAGKDSITEVEDTFYAAGQSRYIMQMWPDVDGSYYVATWGDQTIRRVGPYPIDTVQWTYSIGSTAAAVCADGTYVYAMRNSGNVVYVLNKNTGTFVRQFTLSVSLGSIYGTIAVVNGKLYVTGTSSNRIYRVSTLDGAVDSTGHIDIGLTPYRMGFDGRNICIGDNSDNVECWQVVDRSVYGNGMYPIFSLPKPVLIGTQLNEEQNKQVSELVAPTYTSEYTLCYKASRDGFSATTFHQNCDNKGPSVVIGYSTEGRIAGAYAPNSWDSSSSRYLQSNGGFFFRFQGDAIEKTGHMNYPQYAQYTRNNYCPTFGGGHDWQLDSGCQRGYTNSHSYYSVNGYNDEWLFGSYNSWVMQELEVFIQGDESPIDVCSNVVCPPPSDPCVLPGECEDGTCLYLPAPDGTPCDDGNVTTAFDVCFNNVCSGLPGVKVDSKSYTFTDLHAYTEYAFVVAARSALGTGPPSEAVRARTLSSVPTGSPSDLLIRSHNSTAMHAQWLPPPINLRAGAIIAYTFNVTALDADLNPLSSFLFVANSYATEAVITGLKTFTYYTMTVAATTDAGTGPFSTPATGRTAEGTPLTAPAATRFGAVTENSLELIWDAIPPVSVPGILIGYTIAVVQGPARDCRRSIAANQVDYIPVGITTSHEIVNLESTSTYSYQVQIAARTVSGNGPFSDVLTRESTSGTASRLPCDSPQPTVSVASATSASISITVPSKLEMNGAVLSRVEVFLNETENSNNELVTSGNQVTRTIFGPGELRDTKTVTGLKPYTRYSVTAVVVTPEGLSPVSEAFAIRTAEATPSAIRNLDASGSTSGTRSTIRVVWGEPRPANGRVTYNITATNQVDASDVVTVATTIVNATLAVRAGQVYDVTVVPLTSAGAGDSSSVVGITTADSTVPPPSYYGVQVTKKNITFYLSNIGGALSYYVEYKVNEEGGDFLNTTGLPGQQVVLPNLMPSTTYLVRVRTVHNGGTGYPRQFELSTQVDVVPPPALSVMVINTTSVFISWLPAAAPTDLSQVYGYRLEVVRVAHGFLPRQFNLGTRSTNITLTDLQPALRFKTSIATRNAAGYSQPSDPVQFTMFTTTCKRNQYEARAPDRDVDRVCKSCTRCQAGEYANVPCGAFADTQCSNCTTCPEGEWQVTPCGGVNNAECQACSTCSPDEVEAAPCSQHEDTVCVPRTTTTTTTKPTTTTASTTTSTTTLVCHSSCNECHGPRVDQCMSCSGESYLYEGFCLASCPPRMYENAGTNECTACNSLCEACSGADTCSSCNSGAFLLQSQCLASCPSGHYSDFEQRRCLPCTAGCSVCTQATCARCDDSFYLLASATSTCVRTCPERFYALDDTEGTFGNTCERCSDLCATCSGPYSNQCITCVASTHTVVDGACVPTTPASTADPQGSSSSTSSGTIVTLVAVVIGGLILIALVVIAAILMKRRRANSAALTTPDYRVSMENPLYMHGPAKGGDRDSGFRNPATGEPMYQDPEELLGRPTAAKATNKVDPDSEYFEIGGEEEEAADAVDEQDGGSNEDGPKTAFVDVDEDHYDDDDAGTSYDNVDPNNLQIDGANDEADSTF